MGKVLSSSHSTTHTKEQKQTANDVEMEAVGSGQETKCQVFHNATTIKK